MKRKSSTGERKSNAKRRAKRISVTAADKHAGEWFARLMALQRRLRSPNGCPWDREQSHASLRKFLVEETYETLDAMDSGNVKEFASELGDLLLQIVFHSILAEESRAFTAAEVIESVHTKMVRRHPHVFGSANARTSADVLKNWEQLKAAERASAGKSAGKKGKDESILSGIPRSLPAVLEAYQLTRRASRIGFDWDSVEGVLEKLREEEGEIAAALNQSPGIARVEEEVGDLLFSGVNIARFLGVDPEIALKKANRKFKRRFEWMESAARREGAVFADISRVRKEELWDASKRAEAGGASAAKAES
ncbi:MAG TPA: nucleoside triphosphate pyrophosphohydrolase [Verrucomicrobiae bacterium]|nr:nucleoside triphosphate pyrophosphohydrolase [Verrucomicrobiae bacterium]